MRNMSERLIRNYAVEVGINNYIIISGDNTIFLIEKNNCGPDDISKEIRLLGKRISRAGYQVDYFRKMSKSPSFECYDKPPQSEKCPTNYSIVAHIFKLCNCKKG